MSFTLSDDNVRLITKSLLFLRSEVVVHPKKYADIRLSEIDTLIQEIKERQDNWGKF
jgi:hypothetical protein